MGHRLTKIYTRTGDTGTTGLGDGRRVDKCDARVEAFGAVDETNSMIGLVLAQGGVPARLTRLLSRVQHELFDVGGELSLPGHSAIGAAHVEQLEADLDELNANLPPLRDFILPGGSAGAAACHVARAVCRRAERRTWQLAKETEVNRELLRYLNRLSDLLFVIARVLARENGGREVLWRKDPPTSD